MKWKSSLNDVGPIAIPLLVAGLAYLGTVHATKADLKHARLSSAYASYMASVANNVSGGDLRSVIEAKGLLTLYGEAAMVQDLAEFENKGMGLCEGDGFLKLVDQLRFYIGGSALKLKTARTVLCGDPLVATFDDEPREHRGVEFTFELHFSEQFPLSYKTLEDSAFTVNNGGVMKAARVEKGNNQDWKITVKPVSEKDVTVSLPKGRDCDAPGAICTAVGKQLSNTPSATVRHTASQ